MTYRQLYDHMMRPELDIAFTALIPINAFDISINIDVAQLEEMIRNRVGIPSFWDRPNPGGGRRKKQNIIRIILIYQNE